MASKNGVAPKGKLAILRRDTARPTRSATADADLVVTRPVKPFAFNGEGEAPLHSCIPFAGSTLVLGHWLTLQAGHQVPSSVCGDAEAATITAMPIAFYPTKQPNYCEGRSI